MGKKGISKYTDIFEVGEKFGKYTVINNKIEINSLKKIEFVKTHY